MGAEVFATPRQFLVFDARTRAYYPLCNPTGLTLAAIDCEVVSVDGPVVIACDEFDGSNVAHFLFDCCLRVANFCDLHPELKAKATFVMNGRPTALHELAALTREMEGRVAPSPHRAAKIFISRSDARLRRLANEDELMERLAPLGVRRVVMSGLSWAEQIDIVAHADVVVGPHGMGLTLAAFNFR